MKQPTMRISQTAGFTLIELIVTIAVIGILLPVVIMFLNAINTMNGRANTLSTVNAYAENRIEAFRSAGFQSVPITAGAVAFTGTESLPEGVPKPKSATYEVTYAQSGNTSVKKIVIITNFRSPSGTETKKFITYLGELGVGQQ
ncbi:MAG: type II secretion system protein [Candidatus Saccharimonadales bacterium]